MMSPEEEVATAPVWLANKLERSRIRHAWYCLKCNSLFTGRTNKERAKMHSELTGHIVHKIKGDGS